MKSQPQVVPDVVLRPLKILIVDDVTAMRHLLNAILKGNNIIQAATVGECLEVIRKEVDLDIVLLDISLPDGTAFQVMEQINKEKPSRTFRVCFLTGHKDREEVAPAIQMGVDDYIVKPVNEVLLTQKIQKLMAKPPKQAKTDKS